MVVRMLGRILVGITIIWLATPAAGQRFFPDDPLQRELSPLDVADPNPQSLSALLDAYVGTLADPGERHPLGSVIVAQGVNTLGEVLDGAWYLNRHARQAMSAEELATGAGNSQAPDQAQAWQVLNVKPEGFRPGILIEDSQRQQYLLRFDPDGHLEMSTAAGMIASKFMYALGYWAPENYLVYFDRSQLVAAPGGTLDSLGRLRDLLEEDIDRFLEAVPRDTQRGYRALAIRIPIGTELGPFKFEGTRSDDPNDLFPHEHRRELRGLFVFSAWLNNILPEPRSTLDVLVEEAVEGEPTQFIRHFFFDFQASLGSGDGRAKKIREGNDPLFSWRTALDNFLTGGVTAPSWMRADFADIPAVGLFECESFDPEQWSPRYMSAPLANRLPDDEFWAAKILMALTDLDIRTVVATGGYTDPAAEVLVADCLIERRDRIGRAYFSKVLPLDGFHVEADRLLFDDLSVQYGFVAPREFEVEWARFDNITEQSSALEGADSFVVPPALIETGTGEYLLARIALADTSTVGDSAATADPSVDVYLRREADSIQVVGIDRIWEGKAVSRSRAGNPISDR